MIKEKTVQVQVPNFRLCNLEEVYRENEDGEEKESEYSFIRKKQKIDQDGCGEGFSVSAQLGSNLKSLKHQKKLMRSPSRAFRTSRGRIQILPSKFSDSVVQLFKSRNSRFDDMGSIFENDNVGFVEVTESLDSFRYENKHSSPLMELDAGTGTAQFRSGSKDLKKLKMGSTRIRKEVYRPEDFDVGDIVWARCGKRYPWWPAVVIDRILQAPEAVLNCCVPGALCIMFYGHSKNGTQRDYACVKQGMIFPFANFMHKFQGQTQMFKCKMSDFQMALEEAFLVESGIRDADSCTAKSVFNEAMREFQHASTSSQDLSYQGKKYKDRCCDGCNMMLPCKVVKDLLGSACKTEFLCKHCVKLRKSNQYCGICRKILHHSDGGNRVCCDRCNVWIYADRDNISNKHFKDLENHQYHCPDCKMKFEVQPDSKKMVLPVKTTLSSEEAMPCFVQRDRDC